MIDEDDAGKAFVVGDGVRAAAEDESREIFRVSKMVSFRNVFGFFNFYNIARRAAEAHGCKFRKRDIFFDFHIMIISQKGKVGWGVEINFPMCYTEG